MGKASLIAVALLAASVSWFQLTASDSHRAEARHRADDQFDTLARDAAHTGHAVGAERVVSGPPGPFAPATGRTDNGTYGVRFTERAGAAREVVVRSEGRAGASRHVVEALFREVSSGPPSSPEDGISRVPPYLRYAVFSGEALRLAVLPKVRSGVYGLNADVHTNGALNVATSVDALLGFGAVEGFGTHAGRLSAISLLSDPSRAFRPPTNPDGLPTLRYEEPVVTTPIDVGDVAAVHQDVGHSVRTSRGQLRLLGRVELGTRESPKVLHVEGDLILADVRFEGYGALLVEGSVIVEATLTGLSGVLFGRPEGAVLVASEGPIVFNGVGDVEGHYLTNRSATFVGAATVHGSVAALGSVNFLVAPSIRFVPPAPSLTVGLPGRPPSRMEMVSVREWEHIDRR